MSNDPNTHMNEAHIAAHESPTDVYGHTQAILALAYEQRTANLIALELLLQRSGADIEVDAIQERLDPA